MMLSEEDASSSPSAEIVKRLNAICAQVIPFLSQEHQQQVVQAVERAKQVTMAELNAIIGAQHLSHGHAIPVPLTPHPAGLQPPLHPGAGTTASLLALSSALGHQLPLSLKDDRKHHDNSGEHPRDRDSVKPTVNRPTLKLDYVPYFQKEKVENDFQMRLRFHGATDL
ncbi:Transducin-like enhancer protein 4 [Liparis tanakae]|uniref:Transducin-like enhancer protein 4 n=1 Tax=Liparis tanakae TaxID=230148 RepID=A0A4Z2HP48_9TELE|nr:Transducin-like enhancer protein 4 [Liparis tanakae]